MRILDWARKVQAIAQTGLAFTSDQYDRERYQQLQALVAEVLAAELSVPLKLAQSFWQNESGYATPKVGVRGAVFDGDRILLVRERSDSLWTVPGGWADVNDAPSEAVVREIQEESGYLARASKLAAIFDRNRHPHPPSIHHVYTLFFICDLEGGAAATSHETDAVDFFTLDALPELSPGRITRAQIERMFAHNRDRNLPTDFD